MAAIDQYGLCGDDDDDDDCGSGSAAGSGSDTGSVDQSEQDSSDSPVTFDTLTGAAFAQATLVYGSPEAALSAQGISDAAISFISHTLDIAGILPEVGGIADGINAGIQLSQGNRGQAALYATGAVAAFLGVPGSSMIAKLGKTVSFANEVRRDGEEAATAAEDAYTVYRSISNGGDVQYVGMTNNFERRALQHGSRFDTGVQPIEGLTGLSYSDARAAEQALIETHGIVRYGEGGTLPNKINSISTKNPIYPQAIERGKQLLKGAGYPQ